MGNTSIVSGFIQLAGGASMERTRAAISAFEFDEAWPFTNIFWCDSPAQYDPVVGFAGAYKQVEEVWSEWLWKFGRLLSTLEATVARVSLYCIMGVHTWELRPRYLVRGVDPSHAVSDQSWVITCAPEDDFSIDPGWLRSTEGNMKVKNKETGEYEQYKWDRFLERVSSD